MSLGPRPGPSPLPAWNLRFGENAFYMPASFLEMLTIYYAICLYLDHYGQTQTAQ